VDLWGEEVTSVEEAFRLIAVEEGGVGDNHDGKGTTYYGQTLDWLKSYGLPIPQSPEQAMSNWSVWAAKTKLDQLAAPTFDELLHIVLDYAVHSGSFQAIKSLQCALRVNADGVIGPQTIAALGKSNRNSIAHGVIAASMELQGIIITKHPDVNAKFAEDWAARNARMVRRLA